MSVSQSIILVYWQVNLWGNFQLVNNVIIKTAIERRVEFVSLNIRRDFIIIIITRYLFIILVATELFNNKKDNFEDLKSFLLHTNNVY